MPKEDESDVTFRHNTCGRHAGRVDGNAAGKHVLNGVKGGAAVTRRGLVRPFFDDVADGNQFGIPAGILERDPDPYKWIAYRRFCHAKLRERNRRIHDIVRKYAPGMPIVSTDEGGVYSYEQSAQAELFDIFTQQSGPRGRWRAQVGCVTKVLADLTGKEVWPCVHIENYMLNTTPEETVEEISQVFRNGGTGLHLFLSDIQGSRKWVLDTKVTAVGSPRRWHTLLNIVDLLKTMPVPKYPDYDRTAILFNDDTLAAQPYDAKRPYGEQTESCYTMLGPVARS